MTIVCDAQKTLYYPMDMTLSLFPQSDEGPSSSTALTGPGTPLIISASRRTDLPGFHPRTCAELIRSKISRLRTRTLYGVVFWTKHLKPFLKDAPLHHLVADELDNPIVNLTVTGLGNTRIEPNTPSVDDALSQLPRLIQSFKGEPWRIRWRFDPIIKNFSSLNMFDRLAKGFSDLGIHSCTLSFPSYKSLKGDLTAQFRNAGIPRWQLDEKKRFLLEMAHIATKYNITLFSCAQPENTTLCKQVQPAQCIDRKLLEQGHPQHLPLGLPKDYSQRKHCNCVKSEDIGDYDAHPCHGGCVYCYSKAGGPLK